MYDGDQLKICIKCGEENSVMNDSCTGCGKSLSKIVSVSNIIENWGTLPPDKLAYIIKIDSRKELIHKIFNVLINKYNNKYSKEIIDHHLNKYQEWRNKTNQKDAWEYLLNCFFNKKLKKNQELTEQQVRILNILYSVINKSNLISNVLLFLNSVLRKRELTLDKTNPVKAKKAIIFILKTIEEREKTLGSCFDAAVGFLKEPALDWDIFDILREKILSNVSATFDLSTLIKEYANISDEYQPYILAVLMRKRKIWEDRENEIFKEATKLLNSKNILENLYKFTSNLDYIHRGHPKTLRLLEHIGTVYSICSDFSRYLKGIIDFDRMKLIEAAYYHDFGKIIHLLYRDEWPIITQGAFKRINRDNNKNISRMHSNEAESLLGDTINKEVINIIKLHHEKDASKIPIEALILKNVDCLTRSINKDYDSEKAVDIEVLKKELSPKSAYGEKISKEFIKYIEENVGDKEFLRSGSPINVLIPDESRDFLRFSMEKNITITILEDIEGKKPHNRKVEVLLYNISQKGLLIHGNSEDLSPRWNESILLPIEEDIPDMVADEIGSLNKDKSKWYCRIIFDKLISRKTLKKIVNYEIGK